MIWVPIVSIIVFILVLAPSIIIGVRVGWKSALFIALIFLLISTLWLILGIILFDVFIWDIYKDLVVKPVLSSNINLNIDLLAPYYKPVIYIIIIGFLSPLTAFFTFLLYRGLKRPLNKYLGHKVVDIDVAQKDIVIHKKRVYSRVSGGAILGLSALFIGSSVSSTLNVFLTPYYKSNDFNRFNDFLAKIYSFGQAGNTADTQVIQEFLVSIDQEMINNLLPLVSFSSNSQGPNFLPSTNGLFYIKNNFAKFTKIFEYPLAAKAIFETILDTSNAQIDLLALDQYTSESYLDANNNLIGLNKSGETIFLSNWKDFLNQDKNKLQTNKLPKEVTQVLYDNILSHVKSFEDSIFVQEINNLLRVKNLNQELINQRQEEKKIAINQAEETAKNIKTLINRLNELTGRNLTNLINYQITNPGSRNQYQNIDVGSTLELSNINLSSGLIYNQKIITKNFENQEKEALEVQEKAEQIMNQYYQNSFIPANNSFESARNDSDQKLADYQSKQRYYQSILDKIKSDQEQLNAQKALQEETTQNLATQKNNLETIQENKQTKQELLNNTNRDDPNYAKISLELNNLIQQENDCQETIGQLNLKLANLNSSITTLEDRIKENNLAKPTLESSIIDKKQIWEAANIITNEALEAKKNAQNYYKILENDYLEKKEVYNNYSNRRKDSQNKMKDLVNEFNQGANTTLPNQQQTLLGIENKFDILTTKNDQAQIEAKKSNLDWRNFTTRINDDNSIYWAEQHQAFLNTKYAQLLVIERTKRESYDQLLLQLENIFQDWVLS